MKDFNQIKIRLKLTIGFVIGNHEEDVLLSDYINEEEWSKLNIFEREDYIRDEILKEWANEYIEMSSEVLEEKEEG